MKSATFRRIMFPFLEPFLVYFICNKIEDRPVFLFQFLFSNKFIGETKIKNLCKYFIRKQNSYINQYVNPSMLLLTIMPPRHNVALLAMVHSFTPPVLAPLILTLAGFIPAPLAKPHTLCIAFLSDVCPTRIPVTISENLKTFPLFSLKPLPCLCSCLIVSPDPWHIKRIIRVTSSLE